VSDTKDNVCFPPIADNRWRSHNHSMTGINAKLLARLPLANIRKVTFYKRDEITTDLICCDVSVGEEVWSFHEELVGWDMLIEHLRGLTGFRDDWFAALAQPPFATNELVAFSR
jgi:hypothetical protein